MYVITVVPLGRGILKEELTYFSPEKIEAGSLVSVQIRNKNTPAIVIASTDAQTGKMLLRQLSYSLKKIDGLQTRDFLSAPFVETAKYLAEYYLGTTGAIIHSLVPKVFLKPEFKFEKNSENNPPAGGIARPGIFERFAVMDNRLDRIAFYRGLIRELFAKDQSVIIVTPTASESAILASELKSGIEQLTFTIEPGLTLKKAGELWRTITSEPHPILIIGTGPAISIPRKDLGAIVVENENSRSFKIQNRPFIDYRLASEKLAEKLGIRFYASGEVLRLETFNRLRHGDFLPAKTLRLRLSAKEKTQLIDLKAGKKFSPITPELEQLVKNSLSKSERTFLFVARRGLATETVCGDCGSVLVCENCSAPLVLHGPLPEREHFNRRENYFLCHHCGRKCDALIRCQNCFSWKLRPLGVGSEGVATELSKKFPNSTIIRLDKDSASSPKNFGKGIALFENTPGAVMIGGERALSSLRKPFENGCVVSLDALLSLPDFRINEKVFSILTSIRELSAKVFAVQTRRPEYQVIDFALQGDIEAFIKDETARRRQFFYPPWSKLIKITTAVKPEKVFEKNSELENKLSLYRPDVFPGFIEKLRGKQMINALIKLPPDGWPDEDLSKILSSLSPDYKIEIDPEDLL